MTSDVFVDTSGWLEIVDKRQPFHTLANKLAGQFIKDGRFLVTTHLIMIELASLMTSPMRITKSKQIEIIHDLMNDPAIEIAFIDSESNQHAWHLWQNRVDKDWSLVDCASFVFMHEQRLTQSLTTDHHFEQAGFVRLLK